MLKILGERDVHILLDMCIDAEERCDQRIQQARDSGNSQDALRAIQQKEQYEAVKRKIVAEIQGNEDSLMEDSMVFSERIKKLRERSDGG